MGEPTLSTYSAAAGHAKQQGLGGRKQGHHHSQKLKEAETCLSLSPPSQPNKLPVSHLHPGRATSVRLEQEEVAPIPTGAWP